ncbi:MAG: replicative DNA helicase, partial [Lachnospiraceae bacterium]|nr:replicative DNA helicase [Lachnospiraceae bacterium]
MDENVIKRIMPNDLAAEQSVIGAMLLDANAITAAADILTGDDFYNKQYGVLFETMLELQGAGAPVDPVTLQAKLKEKDVPPEVSNLEFLIDMRDDAITPVHIKQYATIVY